MSEVYRVVISGQTLDGSPLASLRPLVGQVFSLNEAQLDKMLSGRPVVVRKDMSENTARQLLNSLTRVGLDARMEPMPAAAAAVPPPPRPEAPPTAVKRETAPARTGAPALFAITGDVEPPPSPAAPTPAIPPVPPAPPVAPSAPTLQTPAPRADLSGADDPFPGHARTADELALEDTVVCPACGETQPKRTLCRACSIDMPRYRAAQAEQDAEERAAREVERAARNGGTVARPSPLMEHHSPDVVAGILGLGFAGRLDRLSFLNASLLGTVISYLGMMVMLKTGKIGLLAPFVLFSLVYYFRCLALRLHDTNRSGWLSLILLVPLLGFILALIMLFIPGTPMDNDYGPQPDNSIKRQWLVALVLAIGVVGLNKSISDPANLMRMMNLRTAKAAPGAQPPVVARASGANNRIDFYTSSNCPQCDQMEQWMDRQGLRYVIYRVDRDANAAARLQGLLASTGKSEIQLPVLQVNDRLLADQPTPEDVVRQLR